MLRKWHDSKSLQFLLFLPITLERRREHIPNHAPPPRASESHPRAPLGVAWRAAASTKNQHPRKQRDNPPPPSPHPCPPSSGGVAGPPVPPPPPPATGARGTQSGAGAERGRWLRSYSRESATCSSPSSFLRSEYSPHQLGKGEGGVGQRTRRGFPAPPRPGPAAAPARRGRRHAPPRHPPPSPLPSPGERRLVRRRLARGRPLPGRRYRVQHDLGAARRGVRPRRRRRRRRRRHGGCGGE